MALIECGECGKQISSGASRCPHCGVTTPKAYANRSIIACAIVIVVLLFVLGAMFQGNLAGGSGAAEIFGFLLICAIVLMLIMGIVVVADQGKSSSLANTSPEPSELEEGPSPEEKQRDEQRTAIFREQWRTKIELRKMWFSRLPLTFTRFSARAILAVRQALDEAIGRLICGLLLFAGSIVALLFLSIALSLTPNQIGLSTAAFALIVVPPAIIALWLPTDEGLTATLTRIGRKLEEWELSRDSVLRRIGDLEKEYASMDHPAHS